MTVAHAVRLASKAAQTVVVADELRPGRSGAVAAVDNVTATTAPW
jgi:hypothetical protein